MKGKKNIIALLLLCCVGNAYGFDVDGFTNGISYQRVKNELTAWKFDKVEEKDNVIMAYDVPEKNSHRFFVFTFCENRLVGVQKDYMPSAKSYIILVDNYRKRFGKPIDLYTKNELHSNGESHSISTYWSNKTESYTVDYNVFPSNEQLSLSVKTKKACR